MAFAGATTTGATGVRSLSSSHRREATSSRRSGGGTRIVGSETNNDGHGLRRGGAVGCSRRAITLTASVAAPSRGTTGGITARASDARSSTRGLVTSSSRGVVRARTTSLSPSTSPPVVARAAAAASAEIAGDDGAVAAVVKEETVNYWRDAMPANDAIDKQILKLFIPAMLNFLIIPLVGAVDVFWIGRMGSAVALAAQGAANQVFQSAFWIISFMPSVIAPVVAKAAANGDSEEVQRAVGEAVFVALFVGLCGMALLTGKGDGALMKERILLFFFSKLC